MTEQDRIRSIECNGGKHLKNFKPENVTYNMCLAAVKSDGNAITFVPEPFRTKEICTEACRSCGVVLKITPKEFYSDELYRLSVQSSGMALEFVPEDRRTAEICRYAVLENPAAFKFVPSDLVTPDLCLESLKAQSRSVWNYAESKSVMTSGYEAFEIIPASVRNNDLCLGLVKLEPALLWRFPRKNRTVAVCKAALEGMGYASVEEAVKEDPRILIKMHASLCTEEASMIFLKAYIDKKIAPIVDEQGRKYECSIIEDGNILVPGTGRIFFYGIHEMPLKNILKWRSVAEKAVEKEPAWLKDVPDKTLDYDLCVIAVKNWEYAFRYVPKKFQTVELSSFVFRTRAKSIMDISLDEPITDEICITALEKGFDFNYMPSIFKTKPVCFKAISLNAGNVLRVPEEIMDEDLALAAVRNGAYLYYLDQKYKTYEMCKEAVKVRPDNIQNVPSRLLTDELRELARR